MRYLLIRDSDSKRYDIFESIEEVTKEVNQYHNELGDTGFTVYELGKQSRYTFEEPKLVIREVPAAR